MKLLRYGPAGSEKPGLLDEAGNIRDLSAHLQDIDSHALAHDAHDGRYIDLDQHEDDERRQQVGAQSPVHRRVGRNDIRVVQDDRRQVDEQQRRDVVEEFPARGDGEEKEAGGDGAQHGEHADRRMNQGGGVGSGHRVVPVASDGSKYKPVRRGLAPAAGTGAAPGKRALRRN